VVNSPQYQGSFFNIQQVYCQHAAFIGAGVNRQGIIGHGLFGLATSHKKGFCFSL
jgi:hypothetical protein